ncbi:MAG: hypothetical protein KGO93_01840 [Cyanobacteria bacterium REEB446]|nr:hypothetical protein [Cyanobacteria bacterium REEB446]
MLLTIGANFIPNNQPEPIRNEQAAVKLALEKIYQKNTPNLREVHIVSSGNFMDKSAKDNYNGDWVAREVAQNFIDHNPAPNAQTLNNVRFIENSGNPANSSIFQVIGPWAFEHNTGLTTGYSGNKGDNSAGGNGIGIKQVALLLLRPKDAQSQGFGAERFTITGNGWEVSYRYISKEELQKQVPENKFKFTTGWLVAEEKKAPSANECIYSIQTNNPELKAALRQMPDLGVHDNNPYLSNPDYTSEKGSIKWLAEGDSGRLFLNGQVMKTNPTQTISNTSDSNWDTLPGVTVSLSQKYEITLDRNPYDEYSLGSKRFRPLVESMPTEDLITQINKSKAFWTSENLDNYNHKSGALILIKEMVNELKWRNDYSKENFTELFGEHYYKSYGDSDKDIKELRDAGKSIVPDFMKDLGCPAAATLIDKTAQIKSESLSSKSEYDITRAAKDGIIVSSLKPETTTVDTSEKFYTNFHSFLEKYNYSITDTEQGTNKITFSMPEINSALMAHPLSSYDSNNKEQIFLLQLRGFIEEGLRRNYISENDLLLANQDFVYKFGLKEDYTTHCKQLILKAYDKDTEAYRSKIADGEVVLEFGLKGYDFFSNKKIENGSLVNPELDNHELEKSTTMSNATSNIQHTESLVEENEKKKKGGSGWDWFLGIGTVIAIGTITILNSPFLSSPKDTGLKQPPSSEQLKESRSNDKAFQDFRRENQIPAINNPEDISSSIDQFIKSQNSLNVQGSKYSEKEETGSHIDVIEDLQLQNKTKVEAEKIKILSQYVKLSTGIEINPESILVYTGKGALGVNWNQCQNIGLHRETLKADIYTALSTLNHEIGHCASGSRGHDTKFIKANSAIGLAQLKHSNLINQKLLQGESLSTEERAYIDLRNLYNKL